MYMRYPFAHFPEVVIIPHHKGGSLMQPQVIIQLSLPFSHAFYTAKAFQVGLSAIGNDAVGRRSIPAISFDLLQVVCPHFYHRYFCVFFYT